MVLSDVWNQKKSSGDSDSDSYDPTSETYSELKIGEMIGSQYILESIIHEGGMGVLYLASQKGKSEKVVVKMIRLEMVDDQAKQMFLRFRREAKGMAQIRHPNIVSILGCDMSDPKNPYIVMEYVDGTTLWNFMTKHRKGVLIHMFLNFMSQLCSAFDLIHRKGIVHRDLKPNNLMVYKDTNTHKLKILDLGLIFFEKAFTATSQLKLTKKGQLVGTPMYMSPEQCKGERVTHLADIYNMGLIGYELLSGRPAFDGMSPKDLFMQQLKVVPKPITKFRKDIPPKISDAIQKALEKDPAKRPQSCHEFFKLLHFS